MLRRIPEMFAASEPPIALAVRLFEIPLHDYDENCRNISPYRTGPSAAIERTRGTDTVAHCLAYATLHLCARVVASGIRGYDDPKNGERRRGVSRVAGLVATHLIDRLDDGMRSDAARDAAANDHRFEITLAQYRAVSEIMYPESTEMRAGLPRSHEDSLDYWGHALDHAFFIETAAAGDPEIDPLIALVGPIRDAVESFYAYYLATVFGEDAYRRFGI